MRPEIVLFGDSITQQSFSTGGWGASLADVYSRQADVKLRGYGGYNTRWAMFLLHHLFPLDSTKPPVATTVFFGANDAALLGRSNERQHVPLEEYKDNLRRIVHHLKECSPTMVIILITPPPVDEDEQHRLAPVRSCENASNLPGRSNEVTGAYARQCVGVADELGVHSVDLWTKMQEMNGWQKKFLRDGLHLTPEGSMVVCHEVLMVLNRVLIAAEDMPYDFPNHLAIDVKDPKKTFSQ